MNRPEPPFEYLLECSKKSLQAFLLTQLNNSAERRKEVNQLLDEWVEAESLARLATWFEAYGESLVALASSPPDEANGKQLRIDFLAQETAELKAVGIESGRPFSALDTVLAETSRRLAS